MNHYLDNMQSHQLCSCPGVTGNVVPRPILKIGEILCSNFSNKPGNEARVTGRWALLASFPGSSAPECKIELVHVIHIHVLGEPGNEARVTGNGDC